MVSLIEFFCTPNHMSTSAYLSNLNISIFHPFQGMAASWHQMELFMEFHKMQLECKYQHRFVSIEVRFMAG